MGVEQLDFHVARTRGELDDAFRLVYGNYLRAGYISPHPSGLRLGLHNFLPDTRTFVAGLNRQVVATVSLVFDSSVGLPMDAIYRRELDPLRREGRRLVEVTMLADRRSEGPRTLPVVLKLTKILFDYARDWHPSDDLVIAVNPRHVPFYRRFLYFQEIGGLKEYASVRGNPAVALRLDLRNVEERCADDERVRRLYLDAPTPPVAFADPVVLTDEDVRRLLRRLPELLLKVTPAFRTRLLAVYPSLGPLSPAWADALPEEALASEAV